jgi:hypothetical protein
MNAPVLVQLEGETDPLEIAQKELRQGKIPLVIRRYLPGKNRIQYGLWNRSDLGFLVSFDLDNSYEEWKVRLRRGSKDANISDHLFFLKGLGAHLQRRLSYGHLTGSPFLPYIAVNRPASYYITSSFAFFGLSLLSYRDRSIDHTFSNLPSN